MRLLRMLRVSDTFTEGEIPLGRYHMVGTKVLPRFVRSRLAVREAAKPGSGPCPVGEVADGGSGKAPLEEPGGGERAKRVWWVRVVYWLSERFRRPNPFGDTGPRISSTALPRQTCLRLEGVQVVRNDLTDTDFEVTPRGRSSWGKVKVPRVEATLKCDFRVAAAEESEAEQSRVSNL